MSDLKEITTEELERELEARRQAKIKETIFIFIYSESLECFDTLLVPVKTPEDTSILHHMELRCRYNSHRYLNVYKCKMLIKEADELNKKLASLVGQNAAIRNHYEMKTVRKNNRIKQFFNNLVDEKGAQILGF